MPRPLRGRHSPPQQPRSLPTHPEPAGAPPLDPHLSSSSSLSPLLRLPALSAFLEPCAPVAGRSAALVAPASFLPGGAWTTGPPSLGCGPAPLPASAPDASLSSRAPPPLAETLHPGNMGSPEGNSSTGAGDHGLGETSASRLSARFGVDGVPSESPLAWAPAFLPLASGFFPRPPAGSLSSFPAPGLPVRGCTVGGRRGLLGLRRPPTMPFCERAFPSHCNLRSAATVAMPHPVPTRSGPPRTRASPRASISIAAASIASSVTGRSC